MFEATPNCRMRMEGREHGQRQGEANRHGDAEVHEDQQDGHRGDNHLRGEGFRERVTAPSISRVRS